MFPSRNNPTPAQAAWFLRFLEHTQLEDTPCTIHLNLWSTGWRGRYLHITQQIQQPNTHALSGIGTHDISKRVATDIRFRPQGYRDRPAVIYNVERKPKRETILSYFVVTRMKALEFFTPGKTKDVTRRFLGVFARELRKQLLAFVMSVWLSIRPSTIYNLASVR